MFKEHIEELTEDDIFSRIEYSFNEYEKSPISSDVEKSEYDAIISFLSDEKKILLKDEVDKLDALKLFFNTNDVQHNRDDDDYTVHSNLYHSANRSNANYRGVYTVLPIEEAVRRETNYVRIDDRFAIIRNDVSRETLGTIMKGKL